MTKCIRTTMVCKLVLFSCITANAQNAELQLIKRDKAGILTYLKKVIEHKKVIVGQQCSETPDVAFNYKKAFQSVYDSTGKYPALLGLEYGYFKNADLASTNQFAINHWKKGGLVTISWHADNPFKDGYDVRWNAEKNKDSITVTSLLKNAPASSARTNYRAELGRVAASLKQLQDAGVVVLWRPFHEVNGTWFWWGVNHTSTPTNQSDYTALWKDMYETFTKEYKLSNLLWVYSPFASGEWGPPVTLMYPGNKYVDIVAVDDYPKVPNFNDYQALQKLNKLIVNGEIGPAKESYGKFNELEVLNVFKGRAAYFLQWHSWTNAKVSITDNVNYKAMMNDSAAITLDKIQ